MKTSLRRFFAASTVAAMAATGTFTMTGGADATAAKRNVTDYVFNGYSYGAAANTGFVGVSSGPVANSIVGCTRKTGRSDANRVADASLDVLNIGAVKSHTDTYRKRGRVGVLSTTKVAGVKIGDPNSVHLEVNGLSTRANAFANRKGKLKARASFNALDVEVKTGIPAIDGPLGDLLGGANNPINALFKEIRKNGNIELPGLALIQLGERTERVSRKHARARATSLVVKLYGPDLSIGGGDDIRVRIGRASARIAKGVTSGVMNGRGQAVTGSLLDGAIKVGPLGKQTLKCEGTNGRVLSNAVAGVDLLNANALIVDGVEGRAYGKQLSRGRVKAWTEGRVANVELKVGDADATGIKITGIVGRAKVKRTARGKFRRSIRGTKVASIQIGGESYDIPRPGKAIEVPGVVKIQFAPTRRTRNSITVTAVRITLLDGSLGTLELGKAKTKVRRF